MEVGVSPAGADGSLAPEVQQRSAAGGASTARAERRLAAQLSALVDRCHAGNISAAERSCLELAEIKHAHPDARLSGEALRPLADLIRSSRLAPNAIFVGLGAWVSLAIHDPIQSQTAVDAGVVAAALEAALRHGFNGELQTKVFSMIALLGGPCLDSLRSAPRPVIDHLLSVAGSIDVSAQFRQQASSAAFSLLCLLVESDAELAARVARDRVLMWRAACPLPPEDPAGPGQLIYPQNGSSRLRLLAALVAVPQQATAAAAAVAPGLMEAVLNALLTEVPPADGEADPTDSIGRLRAATLTLAIIARASGPRGTTGSAAARADVMARAGALPRLLDLCSCPDYSVAASAAIACSHILLENTAPLMEDPSLLILKITAAIAYQGAAWPCHSARRCMLRLWMRGISSDSSRRLLDDARRRLATEAPAILPRVTEALEELATRPRSWMSEAIVDIRTACPLFTSAILGPPCAPGEQWTAPAETLAALPRVLTAAARALAAHGTGGGRCLPHRAHVAVASAANEVLCTICIFGELCLPPVRNPRRAAERAAALGLGAPQLSDLLEAARQVQAVAAATPAAPETPQIWQCFPGDAPTALGHLESVEAVMRSGELHQHPTGGALLQSPTAGPRTPSPTPPTPAAAQQRLSGAARRRQQRRRQQQQQQQGQEQVQQRQSNAANDSAITEGEASVGGGTASQGLLALAALLLLALCRKVFGGF